ncbi:hypothetical protein L2725_00380 [Shewanella corallii]|uniref:MSHA biogenesis protein MshF n=1 Tax=Shewanella corallii TaxID=560080 RepID=A0ABT0N1E9_9GAMM|nr:hypothetical protein [Shewanella corallii]MCL2912248.1 hypothetical protein [Shewanella corallii]
MDSSEESAGRLQGVFRQMVAVVLLLLVLAVLGYRYFEAVPGVVAQGLQLEQTRLLNVLAMTRSKWLGEGKPPKLTLAWVERVDMAGTSDDEAVSLEHSRPSQVAMADGGWPLPHEQSQSGCETLWYQLLGVRPDGEDLLVEYDADSRACWFMAPDGSRLSYQLQSGEVTFLTGGR